MYSICRDAHLCFSTTNLFTSHGRQIIALALTLAVVAGVYPLEARADLAVAWGSNNDGQIGDGTYGLFTDRNAPVAVIGMSSGVSAIAAGGLHSMAVQNGAAYAWGDNYSGALGDGHGYPSVHSISATPVAVSGLTSGVTAVSAAAGFGFAIQNGALYAWGNNLYGDLGDGTTTMRTSPVLVSGMSIGVTAVAAGGNSYCALAVQNGAVYAWGHNLFGELGGGSTDYYSATPMPVSGLTSGVTLIAAGGSEFNGGHNFAVQNGALYSWGSSSLGVLGRSGSGLTPAAVSGLTNVTAVAAGAYHSLAVQNGHVYAWGSNTSGQLGDGTTTNRSRPVLIDSTDLNSIVAVAAGISASYALSSDGSLWVWGQNALGLGDKQLGRYLTPQHLLPPAGFVFTSIDADAAYAGNFIPNYYHAVATLAPVPEPSSALLFAFGGLYGAAMRRRRLMRCTIHSTYLVVRGSPWCAGLPTPYSANYVVQRKNPGGIYTPDDYNTWRNHFGQSFSFSGSGASATGSEGASVPEPSTVILLILAAAGALIARNWIRGERIDMGDRALPMERFEGIRS